VPDISFIRKENASVLKENGIHGSPDLIIEILLDNANHDKELKLYLYQRHSIPEYIIIDPETKEVWHYLLQEQVYVLQPSPAKGKVWISQLALEIAI
jgi:Uma2 family endonuclease